MFKTLLSKVGWGELPSSFGFTVGDKVEIPFSWCWDLHKGQKKSDGSAVSIFICGKKDLETSQVAAAKNAVQMAKSLRHTHILRALDSVETEGGFYLVTEQCTPLLALGAEEIDAREPATWGLFQALDAMGFLHQAGFTHGLFGPTAVFVTPRGDYRLGSFDLCRKDADGSALLTQRRRSGPSITGWPDPPQSLSEGQSPTIAVDLWGAALMMAYVFGTARAGRHGVDYKIDLARASQDIPPELRKTLESFCKPGPLRGRNPVVDATQLQFFQQNKSVQVMSFLGSLHIRSTEEKDAFFDSLTGLLEEVPHLLQTGQILPELMEAQKFPGQEAAQVLPAILKIGTKLKDEDFKEKVAPLVAQLFASPDRAIRFRLLTSLGDMIDHLDDAMINDKIFPECVNGFTDTNGPIREATVKSLIFFAPRLKPKTLEGRVVKLMVKLLSDHEASIRTNAVICCGRISGHLPKALANETMKTILMQGLKDPFAPCRSASLQTLLATVTLFSAEELAGKLMPGVCHRLVDPEASVSDIAFKVLESLQQHLRQLLEESRAQAGAEDGGAQAGAAEASPAAGSWGSWALTTVGSVVNQQMGKLGVSKTESEKVPLASAPEINSSASDAAPAPPADRARTGSGSGPGNAGGSGGGMNIGKPRTQTAPPASNKLGLNDNVGAAGAGGWGEEEDFWGEFGEKPEAKEEAPAPAAAAPAQASFQPAARAVPPARTAAATKAKAKPAPVKAEPAKSAPTEDDFWKEFDMD